MHLGDYISSSSCIKRELYLPTNVENLHKCEKRREYSKTVTRLIRRRMYLKVLLHNETVMKGNICIVIFMAKDKSKERKVLYDHSSSASSTWRKHLSTNQCGQILHGHRHFVFSVTEKERKK